MIKKKILTFYKDKKQDKAGKMAISNEYLAVASTSKISMM